MPGSQAEVPESKPPPWSHTITGFLVFVPVVHTFSTHEFFSDISASLICLPRVLCIACGPQWSHTMTVSHFSTGNGGMKRSTLA